MPANITNVNQKTYDALAAEYEAKVSARSSFNRQVIKCFSAAITSGKQVLDIGCAVGLDTALLTQLGYIVTGVDVSSEMAKFAQKRNPDSTIIAGDFMALTFPQKFDAIFAQAFIHLYPTNEVPDVLSRMYKLLNKGGVAHVTTSRSTVGKEGWLEKSDYTGKYKRFRKQWTKPELQASLEQAGFSISSYYEITDPYKKVWMVFTVEKP